MSPHNGILNVNKPAGITSFGVVARVRRLTHCRRAGHAGTLDPDATGVLLVCLGQATRMAGLLAEARKVYVAEVQLGAATDTYDASGVVTCSGDWGSIEKQQVENVLGHFRGPVQQVPPMYSALKFQGRPMYKLARSGVHMDLPARSVLIHRLDLIAWTPPTFQVEVECSKGTYIRSLAHDIGQRLGCGAHLKRLERTQCGIFSVENSLALDEFERAVATGEWEDYLQPADTVISHWSAAILADVKADMARCGKMIELPGPSGQELAHENGRNSSCRAYDTHGEFIGILDYVPATNAWHPSMVFSRAPLQPCEYLS
ncbi:MAG: tRNA pseudouridine(55) synthase TruB [Chloroflexi bacterium]|nr:tRNA pseudouridine(55) synthase TruB [Chloroflexota bacterium]